MEGISLHFVYINVCEFLKLKSFRNCTRSNFCLFNSSSVTMEKRFSVKRDTGLPPPRKRECDRRERYENLRLQKPRKRSCDKRERYHNLQNGNADRPRAKAITQSMWFIFLCHSMKSLYWWWVGWTVEAYFEISLGERLRRKKSAFSNWSRLFECVLELTLVYSVLSAFGCFLGCETVQGTSRCTLVNKAL